VLQICGARILLSANHPAYFDCTAARRSQCYGRYGMNKEEIQMRINTNPCFGRAYGGQKSRANRQARKEN
jgi:hypothetical protein